jgi:uncharacterized membrane protein HdeD (DUF308 family)
LSGSASTTPSAPDAATAWYIPIARAVLALALAVVITFSADHSASLGLVTFGVFGLVSGAVTLLAAVRSRGAVPRGVLFVHAAVAILAGLASIAVPRAGLPFLVFVVTVFAVVTGFLELYLGLRGRRVERSAKDRIFLGGLTIVLAIALLLVPPGFAQSFTGPDGVARQLTASVVVVGLLGAYWAVAGIYLVIAGLSLRWGSESSHDTDAPAREA